MGIKVVDGCYVGMVQLGESESLSPEAPARLVVGQGSYRKNLDGDIAVQSFVTGTVDHTHAA